MAKFDVSVEGVTYEVDAPNEDIAWAWAWDAHKEASTQIQPETLDIPVPTKQSRVNTPKEDTRTGVEKFLGFSPIGTAEAAISTATGMAAFPLAGIYGVGALIGGADTKQADQAMGEFVEGLTYTPRTEKGKEYSAEVGEALHQSGVMGLMGVHIPTPHPSAKALTKQTLARPKVLPQQTPNGIPVVVDTVIDSKTGNPAVRADGSPVAARIYREPIEDFTTNAKKAQSVLAEIKALAEKSDSNLKQIYKDDPDRLYARVADENFNLLSEEAQRFLINKPAQDFETGAIHRIGQFTDDAGSYGNMNVHGSHIFNLRTMAEETQVVGKRPTEIRIDVEQIYKDFDNKPWTNPKVEGVEPLPATAFKTPEEYMEFVLTHEEMHGNVSRPANVSKGQHETLINEMALNAITERRIESVFEKAGLKDLFKNPDLPTFNGNIGDYLYNLKNLVKEDQHSFMALEKALMKEGLDLPTMQKLRRYAERTLEGNERIGNVIKPIKDQIRKLYEDNSKYYNEGSLRSKMNPEGKNGWQQFPYRKEVTANNKKIADLRSKIIDIESKLAEREKLNPKEQAFWEKVYSPFLDNIVKTNKELIDRGLMDYVETNSSITGGYFPRIKNPKAKTTAEAIKESLGWSSKYDTNTGDLTTYVNNAQKDRAFFALEDSNGRRQIGNAFTTEKGTFLTLWQDGNKVKTMKLQNGELFKPGETILGRKVKEATTDELNFHTDGQYVENSLGVLGVRAIETRDTLRMNNAISDLINSDWFKQNAVPIESGKVIPEGFRPPEHWTNTPQLRNYALKEDFARAVEDFNRPMQDTVFTKGSNVIVKNMMLNPLPHMHNELFHWGMTRGASGFLNPMALARLGKTLPTAVKEVMNEGQIYRQIMREGGSVMSANVRNNMWLDKSFQMGMKELKRDKFFDKLANAMGRKPAEFYQKVSMNSNKAMWTVRDILYTQVIMEKMQKGMTMPEAIKSVERHLPNYRLPTTVGSALIGDKAGRVVSKALQNPNLVLFARYKHGMLSSIANTVKDLAEVRNVGKKNFDKAKFYEGVDTAAAVAIAIGVMYPIFDNIVSAIGDALGSDAVEYKVRRPGASHIFDAINYIAKSEKDQYALLSALVTFNPVLQTMFELGANYQLYNRRNIYNPEDEGELIAGDLTQYLANRIPMASQYGQASNDYGGGLSELLFRQFDVKTKTADQLERIEDQVERRKTAAENRADEEL